MADIPISVEVLGGTKADQDLAKVTKSTEKAGKEVDNLTKRMKEYARQQKVAGMEATKAANEAKRIANENKDGFSQGAGLAGAGRFGQAGGLVAGAGGMSKTMAALTVGATLVGSAVSILNTVLTRSQELALKAAEANATAEAAALKRAETLQKNQAGAFAQNGGKFAQLEALSGGAAVTARELLKKGVTDATDGILELAKSGKFTNLGASQAATASQTGLVSFTEAAKIIAKFGDQISARQIVGESLGRNISPEEFARIQERSGGVFGRTSRQVGLIQGQTQDQLLSNPAAAIAQARSDRADLLAPGMRELTDAFKVNNAKLEALGTLADAQGTLSRIWQNATNPDGSLTVRLIRQTEEAAASAGLGAN
jgi:hypothetical protein